MKAQRRSSSTGRGSLTRILVCTVRSSAWTTNACSPGAVASNTAEKVPSPTGVAGTPFTVTSATGKDGVSRSVAVSPGNRTYRSHSARTNRARAAAWTKKSSLPSHGKITQEIVDCCPGLQSERRGMQDEASPVIALQRDVPLDAVADETPLGEHQSEMRRRPAHPQREDEARRAAAEHVRVAALRVLLAAQVIPILERQRDADVPHRREDRCAADVRDDDLGAHLIAIADGRHRRLQVGRRLVAMQRREAHVGVGVVRAQPVHPVRVAAEDQFHEGVLPPNHSRTRRTGPSSP